MFFRYLLYAFLIYLLYRFIFHFIIPIYKTTRHVKKQFRDMQDRMQEQMKQEQGFQQQPGPNPQPKKNQADDYIDFEEVK